MLERSDWITPTLQGKPWLEKPVLYYWQAMLSFRVAGVTDQTARLPAAFDAALLIAAIYLFLRRFRPGSELDGALITASCAGVIGFARAAATDMPLAAAFSIALFAWYAWYESRRHIYLAAFYIALALGTLAKGPVAPALAAVIIFLFVGVKRDWRDPAHPLDPWHRRLPRRHAALVYRRSTAQSRILPLLHPRTQSRALLARCLSPPRALLVLLPVFLLAMMPWTLALILVVAERVRLFWAEGKQAFSSPETSWPLFLLIWMLVPILFFSASQSKLPGYILPAVPAGALLVAEYLASRGRVQFLNAEGAEVSRRSRDGKKLPLPFAAAHGVLCGLLIFAALSAASIAMNHHLLWGSGTYVGAAIAAVFALGIGVALLSRAGVRLLRPVTMFAVVVSVGAVIRLAAPVIDATQSARPIARSIQAFSHEPVPIALYHVNRVLGYGLDFYFNRPVQPYENGNIPASAHVLVAAQGTQLQVAQLVPGRRVSYLTSIPEQKLDLYWVK